MELVPLLSNILNYAKTYLIKKFSGRCSLITTLVKLIAALYIFYFFYRLAGNSLDMDSQMNCFTYGWFLIQSDFNTAYDFFFDCISYVLRITGLRSSGGGPSAPSGAGSNSNNPQPSGPNGPNQSQGPVNTASSHDNNDTEKSRRVRPHRSVRRTRSSNDILRKWDAKGNPRENWPIRARRREGALDYTDDLSIIDESVTLQIPKVSKKRSHEDLCDLGAR